MMMMIMMMMMVMMVVKIMMMVMMMYSHVCFKLYVWLLFLCDHYFYTSM